MTVPVQQVSTTGNRLGRTVFLVRNGKLNEEGRTMHTPISWYDTPLGQLSGGEERRRAQPSVPDVVVESTRRRVDPYVAGLAFAMAVGAGRVPFIP